MIFKLLSKKKRINLILELMGKVVTSDLLNGDAVGTLVLNNHTYNYEVLDYKPDSIRYVIVFVNYDGSLVLVPESVWNKRGTFYESN